MSLTNSISDSSEAIVLYHGNCMDGFGAAYVFHKLKEKDYPDSIGYFPCNYGEPINSDIKLLNKDIYILDFSFSKELLTALAITANKVILLDHHKSAQADLEDWIDKPANLEIIFDMNRSGAGITWDYFSLDKKPQLIEYIQDRDLWKFALIYSKPINLLIATTSYKFHSYRNLETDLETDLDECVSIGQYLQAISDKFIEQMVAEARKVTITLDEFGPIEGFAVNTFYMFSSEIGNILAKKSGTFGMTYYTDKNGDTRVSLRSIGDFDVSKIAKNFGGGGHKNAAGFCLYAPEDVKNEGMKIWRIDNVSSVL